METWSDAMAGAEERGWTHTVEVMARGRLLDRASFGEKADADFYEGCVRRWACDKGILVEVWSDGRDDRRRAPLTRGVLSAAVC